MGRLLNPVLRDTSSVDTETERFIQQGLARVLAGRIAFIIAHRLSTVRHATRIVVVHDGEIVGSGTHKELIAAQGRYAALYRQQSLREATRGWAAVEAQATAMPDRA